MSAAAIDDLGTAAPELRAALRRHVITLADTKRILGIRYSDWLLGAPSIEAGIAASSMAQDEWGHARLLYALLKELGEDPHPVEYGRECEAWASCDPLDTPLDDWAALVAAMVVVDVALSVALEGLGGGAWAMAGSRIPKMLGEEEFHTDLATAWARRLASAGGEARDVLADAVAAMLPRTLAWVAPTDDAFGVLSDAGIVPAAPTLEQAFRTRLAPMADLLGVETASLAPARDGWDPTRGRGPGHPGLEAVERARGDRNRALFVE